MKTLSERLQNKWDGSRQEAHSGLLSIAQSPKQNKKCTKGVSSQKDHCSRTSSVFGPVNGRSQVGHSQECHNYWSVLVCKATGKKWSNFTQTKSDMVERTYEHLRKLKTRNILVHYIRLDPLGKNQKLANVRQVAIGQYCSHWISISHHVTSHNTIALQN